MARSINDFADKMSKSYASKQNAETKLNIYLAHVGQSAGALIHQRTDGRWVAIVVNPEPGVAGALAHAGIGVWS